VLPLLDWLRTVFEDADDESARLSARHGFPLHDDPAYLSLCAIRPKVFQAITPFLSDPNPVLREGAIAAAIPLLDDRPLFAYRSTLVPLACSILAVSPNPSYRRFSTRSPLTLDRPNNALRVRGPANISVGRDHSCRASQEDSWADDPPF
jgi:hypothetical protein